MSMQIGSRTLAGCEPAKHLRPRGHIRELPSGSFQVIVYAGTDPLTKKPRYIRETLKTYGAAEVALTGLQGQVDQNRYPETDITLGQAISRWLDIAKLGDTYRQGTSSHLQPRVAPQDQLLTKGPG
jgi:integrase